MVNHIQDPATHIWPLNFPTGEIRPPRRSDPRTGTGFDPDPDGGEEAREDKPHPTLLLAGFENRQTDVPTTWPGR